MRPGIWGIVIVVLAILLLFGWKRLPDLARSTGQSLRIFKSEVDQLSDKGDKDRSAASQDTVRGQATPPPAGSAQSAGAPTEQQFPQQPGYQQPAAEPQRAEPRDDRSAS